MSYSFDVAISFARENEELADTIYHYLKAEGLSVFFAPASECQSVLSGENQREIFYRIFGLESRYVVLLVSKYYVVKRVPMEEARIAFSKHAGNASVIPIYIDGTELPKELLDPRQKNYFPSGNAADIASHVASKIKKTSEKKDKKESRELCGTMKNERNKAETQILL